MVNDEVISQIRAFVAERDWAKFHTPENLAKSIVIEAAELLETFQWNQDAEVDRVRDELADVLTYCILLSDSYGFDLEEIILKKLELSRTKYPVDRSFGNSAKYDRLQD